MTGKKNTTKEVRTTFGYRKYDIDIVIKQMMEWVEDESSINFAGFCFLYGYLPAAIWKWDKENPQFSEAYTLVKMKLCERRERLVNAEMLNYGSFMRYQKGYDPFLSKEEDEEKDKDAKRKKGVAEQEQANLFLLAKLAGEGKISQK